ncbi:transcription antitermination factor NusB [Psychrobacter sp. I-STPA6b]|uniref:transcription antitermination factor NusB n=1 Tax=Psychrobacter sp. I-STPA6b TaxID=2585718 RepID=UPI001D0C0407|nr:transcription antitermination factor NusB [Psychrobacter sp. I-STPA6b]
MSDTSHSKPSHANPQTQDETQQSFDINESSYKTSHTAVRKARRFALQGIYEWLMTDHRFEQDGQREWKANAPHDIAARTRATNAMHTVHLGYYHQMMRDIPEQIDELDELISQHLDRELNKLDMIEHAILLIGTYELKYSLHIPYKVVLDEAMKLNTHFGATDAHKLINAVLDKMAVQLRAVEVNADKSAKSSKPQPPTLTTDETGSDTTKPEPVDTTPDTELENKTTDSHHTAKPRISRKSQSSAKVQKTDKPS